MLSTPNRGFPQSEFEQRTRNAQALMQAADIDVLLLSTHADIYYFSGFLTQFWQSPTRPWFLLIPQQGKPVAVIPGIGLECMQRTWVSDIRCWSSPHPTDDGVSLLIDTLLEIGQASCRLGVPMNNETTLRMPMQTIHALQQGFSYASWQDSTQLIRNVRAIKSENEIDKIRYIASIASTAFELIPTYELAGRNEIDLFRQFKLSCIEQGADDCAYLVGGSGPNGYSDVISPPGPRQLQQGDVFMLDTGCVWDGYYCDFDRNFAVGTVSELANDTYQALWDATELALQSIKPGMSCKQVFDLMMSALPAGSDGSVGRIGHGLGIDLTEPPSITHFDETELKTGMVMTLEPSLNYGDGLTMVHEENIVIRESGVELLSRRAAQQLPVCQRC